MLLLALLGYPVSHSASPAMQEAALSALGIEGRYLLWPTPPEAFPQALADLRQKGFAGANVTLPHKAAAFSLADRAEESARRAEAANVLYREGALFCAANTDGEGLLSSLRESWGDPKGAQVAWVGTGGVARTAASALKEAGADITLIGRKNSCPLAERLGAAYLPLSRQALEESFSRCDILIQATPATMQGEEVARELLQKLPLEKLPSHALVCDLVYRPRQTLLLKEAAALGLKTLDGSGMLLYQGAAAFTRFTGRDAPVEVMRAALEKELSRGD